MSESEIHAGKIELEAVEISTFSGANMSLISSLLGFQIFEDLFSNTMTGRLSIQDGNGLIERLPIVGDESIFIRFNSPFKEKSFEQSFMINSITNRQKISDRKETYDLELVSVEFLRSQHLTADKAYTGFYISDIVKSVYDIVKHPNSDFAKPIEVEQTIGKHQFIAPENAPFEFIQLLCSEARSKDFPNNSCYLFYEDRESFRFKTIASLIYEDPVENYYYGEANVEKESSTDGDKNVVYDHQIIEETEIINTFDVIKQTNDGFYDNYVTVIDPIFKQKKDFVYTYDKNFKDLETMTGNRVFSKNSLRNTYNGASHSRLFVGNYAQDNQNYYQESYLNNRCTPIEPLAYFPSSRYRFLNNKIAIQCSLNNMALNLKVPGNSDLKPGDTVNVFIPNIGQDEEIKDDFNYFFGDNERTAKFLVVRVNHVFSKDEDKYMCHIKVVKDTLANPIIAEEAATLGLDYTT